MKTALISGGTSGIGLSIAKALLQQNYKVYFIGRNPEKGKAVESMLDAQSPGNAEFAQLDLSNIKEVKNFARQFSENHSELDLLANIAGVLMPTRQITDEGFEKTFAVNYLSALVLSTELAPLLEKALHGKIANVAGVVSFVLKASLDFDDLDFSRNYKSFRTAITAIHAKTVLTEILSEKFASRGIDVNSFNPGPVRSDLMANMPRWGKLLDTVTSPFMSKECKTGIYVCSSPEVDGITGKLFNRKKPLSLSFDKAYKERLWQESQNLIGTVAV